MLQIIHLKFLTFLLQLYGVFLFDLVILLQIHVLDTTLSYQTLFAYYTKRAKIISLYTSIFSRCRFRIQMVTFKRIENMLSIMKNIVQKNEWTSFRISNLYHYNNIIRVLKDWPVIVFNLS